MRAHAALIHAWADGAEIQQKDLDGQWRDIEIPHWIASREYRVKPAAVRLRVAQFREGDGYLYYAVKDEFQPKRNTLFVKFVGEPIEVYE
jgi:hypothetical protein